MEKVTIDPLNIDHQSIQKVARCLEGGGVVVLPTDTVYGLAARVDDNNAVERLYAVKERSRNKPFTTALDDPEKAIRFHLAPLPPFGYRLLEELWPGPFTLVFYDKNDNKIGVRVPDSDITRAVIREANIAVYLPSANISGKPDVRLAAQVDSSLAEKIDLLVDGGSCRHGHPSTVLDLTFYPFKILRAGVVPEQKVIDIFTRRRILFVCTGNTCRSPMAQFLLRAYLDRLSPYARNRYEIISRGISAFTGHKIASNTAAVLKEKEGIDADSFVSRKLDRYDIISSDLIFTMEQAQLEHILHFEPTAEGRVFHLNKFLAAGTEKDINDPIGGGRHVYELLYSTLRSAVTELIDWL